MTVWMTVPVDTRQQYLVGLVERCGLPIDQVVIVRGSTSTPAYVSGAHHLDQPEGIKNIQHWWNMGIDFAEAHGATHVFVAPDDVLFGSTLVTDLEAAMTSTGAALAYPTSCGMACFMIDLSSDVRPDDQFSWWFGDDDLMQQATGRTAVIDTPVWHLHPNQLTGESELLQSLARDDEVKYRIKWPHTIPV